MNASTALATPMIPVPHRNFASPASAGVRPRFQALTGMPVRIHPAHREALAPTVRRRPSSQVESNLALLDLPLTLSEPELMSGLRVAVTVDASAQQVEEKLACLRHALKMISEKAPGAFSGMVQLEVVLGSAVGCELACTSHGQQHNPYLFLGDRILSASNSAQDSANDDTLETGHLPTLHPYTRTSARAVRFIVHELAYLIHAHKSSDRFALNKQAQPLWTTSGEISIAPVDTALPENDEFVAEVFTGLIHGKLYAPEVMNQYTERKGPNVPL